MKTYGGMGVRLPWVAVAALLACGGLARLAGAVPAPPDAPRPRVSAVGAPAAGRVAPAPAPVRPRRALKVTSREQEREILNLLGRRRQAMDDLLVLRRLGEQKRKEQARLIEELEERYGIRPDRNYRYDPATRRLYDAVPADGNGDAVDEVPLLTFESDEDAAQFGARVGRKRVLIEMMTALELLSAEKLDEIKAYDALMTDKHSLSPDKAYRYERATMELFEVDAPVPGAP